jgi:hypothetical protein
VYSGQWATLQLGEFGLLTDMAPGQIPRGALIKAFNVSFETGLITKAPGARRYNINQVLPSGVVAVHDYWPDTVSQRLIAACRNGSIYRDIGDRVFSSATAIHTGLMGLDERSMFVEAGAETTARDKKLFFFSGTNQVKVLAGDAAVFTTMTSPAVDWVTPNFPSIALVHRNRLWAFMKQAAYASDTGNHENFTSNNLIQYIFPGEGGNISGAFVFRGRLFAFKEGGFVYYLDDSNEDSSNWIWQKLASNFGLASSHGIVQVANDMIAVNESGSPVSYEAVQNFGDIESADILRLLQIEDYYRNSTSLAGINLTHALYYEAKKQLFFTTRTSYRTTNNALLHIDMNKQAPRAALWTKDQVNCLAQRKDINKVLRPIYGAEDGYIYLMDQEDRLTGSTAYTGEFKTSHTDFRFMGEDLAARNKLFDFLAVEFIPQGSWNLEIDVYIDGTFSETINFLMDVRDDGLGSFTLDTDPLGREETQTIQKPLHGSGRRISFHCKQSGSNQNFALASLSVGFRVSGEQAFREA